MTRKRLIIQLVTLFSLILLIIIASGIALHVYGSERLHKLNAAVLPNSMEDQQGDKIFWTKSFNSYSNQLEINELPAIVQDTTFRTLPVATSMSTSTSTSTSIPIPTPKNKTTKRFLYNRPSHLPFLIKSTRNIKLSQESQPLHVESSGSEAVIRRLKDPLPSVVPAHENEVRSHLLLESENINEKTSSHHFHFNSSISPREEGVVNSEPVGEVRSAPVFIQSRPVYSKPTLKPKSTPKLPQSLSISNKDKDKETSGQGLNNVAAAEPIIPDAVPDVERITQTVYGFLDFVTTIGNTVMVFTPQTKKVEGIVVKPTTTAQAQAQATINVQETAQAQLINPKKDDNDKASNSRPNSRQPKLISIPSENISPAPPAPPVFIEASEVEPQIYSGESSITQEVPGLEQVFANIPQKFNVIAQPIVPSSSEQEQQIRTQVNVVESSPYLGSGEFIEGEFPIPGADDEEKVEEEPTTPKAKPHGITFPSKPKGFTLKLTQKHMSPVIITPAFSTPVIVTAQKVNLPPPPPPPPSSSPVPSPVAAELEIEPKPEEPTGIINRLYETKTKDGTITVVETKIIGTYIGNQYARILESTSSIIPKIEVTKSKPFVPASVTILAQKAPQTTTTAAPSTSTENYNDNEFNENDRNQEVNADQDHDQLEDNDDGIDSSSIVIEPTPTASEEQTHYILPQKAEKPEKIYVSPIPNPNAYSRQPQLYVDVNPAKSVDVIVTATPTRGKPFRLTNRFSNRNKNAGSDSNELTQPQEAIVTPAEETSSNSRGRSRFGRNRGRSSNSGRVTEEVVPTISVYSHVISATPSRRFKSGGGRTTTASSNIRSKEYSYKTASGGNRGFNPNGRSQSTQVSPTSSSSIYRFKLNRPTGRWRFKPSPKPKVNIIKTKEDEDIIETGEKELQGQQPPTNGPVYLQNLEGELQHPEETRTESNELVQDIEPELVPQTIRVTTITPTDFSELDKYLEIATIKSPYVFQAGNVKNTRYITVTKTFTKEVITPTLSSSISEASLENILATKAPYEKILEGSNDVATLPVIALGADMATPPLETITQSFSTTQLMLKTSILPVLYDGVTTLYTLTQSYFITRLVTAHKTVPPVELFQFVPTKSLNEFNTALQEAGSEHREHLLGSESEDENDTNYEHIIAPPDELTSVGSDFDPSSMDEKIPRQSKRASNGQIPKGKSVDISSPNPFAAIPNPNSIQDSLGSIAGLTPEQLAFIRYFTAQNQQQQQHQQQHQIQQQSPILPQTPSLPLPPNNLYPQLGGQGAPTPNNLGQPQYSVTSSAVVVDTIATVTETKTLRLLFGAKPTYTVLYSTKVVPTRMTTYVTASIPVKPTAAIGNPFLNQLPFPLAYVG